ncbi:hypothetical protein C7447_101273 [Tenacibaculum adriaticum]|uniref:Uncharacterized protein n=1 Tax=Tenacibaculum adriaticum TaxID=413713 RepID=A0A5S5DYK0_9FLAO|nr:hypothetical protein [Tenacibaculum adriaticum]TYP99669.1 hypothetical protein C7447_101273 [Tenacibaculum adriaticum]
MFYEVLEKSKINKKVIGISLYGDVGFYCGVVLDYSDDVIQLQQYTKYGQNDGVTLQIISEIERIDFNDSFTNTIEFLAKNQEALHATNYINKFYSDLDDEDWQNQVLDLYLKERKVMLSLQINNDDYYQGFVEAKNELTFSFRCIGDLGEDKGLAIFKIEDVSSIKIDDFECRKRLLLYNKKHR